MREITKKWTVFLILFFNICAVHAQSGQIDIQIKTIDPTACNQADGEIHITPLNGIAPFDYSINGGDTFQSDSLFTGLSIGTYVVLVRDSQYQISSFKIARLSAEGAPSIRGIVLSNPPKCGVGGTLKILAEAGISPLNYSIDNGLTFQTSNIYEDLAEGTYHIIVANADGSCGAIYPIISFAPESPINLLEIQTNKTNPTCGKEDGTVIVRVSGGSGDYLYSLDNGANYQLSGTFNNVGEGSYTVLVKDTLLECEKAANGSISLAAEDCPSCDSLTIGIVQNHPSCDSTNGQIVIAASGTSGNYEYSLDNGGNYQSDPIFNDLGAGNYTVTVRDITYDCTKNASSTMALAPTDCPNCDSLLVEIVKNNPTCDSSDGQIVIVATGTSGNYEYSVDNGQNFQKDPLFNGLSAGNYPVTVRDITNDCSKNRVSEVALVAKNCLKCDSLQIISFLTFPNCDSLNGQIELTVSGGSGKYLISVNGSAFQPNTVFKNLGAGDFVVTVKDSLRGCEKSFSTINLTEEPCNCALGIFDQKTIDDHLNSCEEKGLICLDVGLEQLMKYELLDNGVAYTGGLMGCNFDTMLTYLYFTLPGQGFAGPYRLDRWEVNDSIYTGEFQDIKELVQMMNAIDVNTTWTRDSLSMTLKGGSAMNEYGAFEITQISTNMMGVFQLNTNYLPMGSQLSLALGNHQLIFKDKESDCTDTLLVNVTCDECPALNLKSAAAMRLENCTEQATFCFDGVNATELANYSLLNNGVLYSNDFGVCDTTGMGFSIALDTGRHELIFNHNSLNCTDTFILNVVCPTCPTLNLMSPTSTTLDNCDTTAIFCFAGIAPENLSLFTIKDNGVTYSGNIGTCDTMTIGFSLALDTGSHQIIIENTDLGCQFTYNLSVSCQTDTIRIDTIIEVGQIDTICFVDLLMDESVVSIEPTCEGQSPAVGFEINNLTNCLIYEGLREGMDTICIKVCLADNTCKEVVVTVTVMEEDTTCQDLLGSTATVLLENCDSIGLFCLGVLKADLNQYSLALNGNSYAGNIVDCATPEQASLQLGVGIYEVILTKSENQCSDTVMVTVLCEPEMEVFMDTVEVNETDTFCIDSTQFAGTLVSIKNLCQGQAGEFVLFEIDTLNFCLSYTGVEEGRDTACIEVCDNIGTCDTTIVVISVEPEPDTIPLPIAVNDFDTLTSGNKKTLNILGNDTTNSTLITLIILDEPNHGMVFINPDMTITYMSTDTACTIVDSFRYELCNPSGCDTATVELFIDCKAFIIYNGFSPNLDGINETFTIDGIEDFPNNKLIIYNRWGNKVFEQNGYKGQWDGTWKDKFLPDGTYYYLLDDGEGKQYSGFLQIER